MKCIVWANPDGSVRVTVPMMPPLEGESEAMYMDRIALETLSCDVTLRECVRLTDVDESKLPIEIKGEKKRKLFRNCWRVVNGMISVDIPLARVEVIERVRKERNTRLTDSDTDKHRLDDIGTPQQKQALAAYRQQLRDLPVSVVEDVEMLADVDSLDKYTPSWPTKPI